MTITDDLELFMFKGAGQSRKTSVFKRTLFYRGGFKVKKTRFILCLRWKKKIFDFFRMMSEA